MSTKTTKTNPETGWEIKDRTYILKGNRSPITWTIQSKHTSRKPLLYFDEVKGENKEIRYLRIENGGHNLNLNILFPEIWNFFQRF
jgi:hypothetical protein